MLNKICNVISHFCIKSFGEMSFEYVYDGQNNQRWTIAYTISSLRVFGSRELISIQQMTFSVVRDVVLHLYRFMVIGRRTYSRISRFFTMNLLSPLDQVHYLCCRSLLYSHSPNDVPPEPQRNAWRPGPRLWIP